MNPYTLCQKHSQEFEIDAQDVAARPSLLQRLFDSLGIRRKSPPSTDDVATLETCHGDAPDTVRHERHSVSLQPSRSLMIGKYIVTEVLGTGTFSKVKLATDSLNGKQYAMKIIPRPSLAIKNSEIDQELSIMHRLCHPNIAALIDKIETDEAFCVIMELVRGKELFEYVFVKKQLAEAETRHYFRQIVDAIEYMHQQGICHRDLKLENILIAADDTVKLVDFGLSCQFVDEAGNEMVLTQRCGSEEFVSPEVIMAQGYSGASNDVWALGVNLFTMLAGRWPFEYDSRRPKSLFHKICRGEFTFPADFGADVRELIRGMLCPVVGRRMKIADIKASKWMNE